MDFDTIMNLLFALSNKGNLVLIDAGKYAKQTGILKNRGKSRNVVWCSERAEAYVSDKDGFITVWDLKRGR